MEKVGRSIGDFAPKVGVWERGPAWMLDALKAAAPAKHFELLIAVPCFCANIAFQVDLQADVCAPLSFGVDVAQVLADEPPSLVATHIGDLEQFQEEMELQALEGNLTLPQRGIGEERERDGGRSLIA